MKKFTARVPGVIGMNMLFSCMFGVGFVIVRYRKNGVLKRMKASGLMNLITFPMIIFSGVFFSLEGMPQIMQNVSRFFPLTHFIEASRAVMIDGAGIIQILPNILVLGGMTIVFLVTASILFRWE